MFGCTYLKIHSTNLRDIRMATYEKQVNRLMKNGQPKLDRLTNLRTPLTVLLLSVWIKIFAFFFKERGPLQFSRCLCTWLQLFISFSSHSSQRWDCHFLSPQYQSLPHTISPVTPGGWCSNASAPCRFSSQKRLKTLTPNHVWMCVHPHYFCSFVISGSTGPPSPRNWANNIDDFKGKD